MWRAFMKRASWLILAAVMFLAFSGITRAGAYPGEEPLPPYTGVIYNRTGYDIWIPSLNSSATLLVPARGWIEYTVWSPTFEVLGYVNGKLDWCQRITVTPGALQFLCKRYDFSAEIRSPVPVRKIKPWGKRWEIEELG
jgi:hypothetical protein